MSKLGLLALVAVFFCHPLWAQFPVVEVHGLLKDAAILGVNGQSKLMRVGESLNGVTLVQASSRSATVEIDGESFELTMSTRISSNYTVPDAREVLIPRNEKMQYQTNASINGRQIAVLVDTGANIVAMNEFHARAIGLPADAGEASRVETASGMTNARVVMLKSVDVGGIRVESVQASVLEGEFPTTILLGMTFLRHVSMSETGGVLSLSTAY
ncbi:MAG: aspartyl protease family protein [Halioglobus sp.]|jgi:aspartyl protease family protein